MKTQFKLKSILILTFIVILKCNESNAQNVAIGETLFQAHPSSLLELKSSERGFLITRLTTTQRDAIQNPAEGLMIFNSTTKCLEIFVLQWFSYWCYSSTGCIPSIMPISINGNNTICNGDTAFLHVVGGMLGTGAEWYWYTNSCGEILIGSGSNINLTPTSNTIYYVRAEGDCDTTNCIQIEVVVNPNPPQPGTIGIQSGCNCEGSTVTFTMGTCPNDCTCYWQTTPDGTSTANSSNSWTSGSTSGSVTAYVRARNNITGCWSVARSRTVSIYANPQPPPTISSNTPQCIGIGVSFTRESCPVGSICYWQTSPVGTSTMDSNTVHITSADAGLKTIYLRALSPQGCWGEAVSATGIVQDNCFGMQKTFDVPGTYDWIVPQGVTSISVLCVGGGGNNYLQFGGGGGGLRYRNNISVVPGETIQIVVGGAGGTSSFGSFVYANGGMAGLPTGAPGGSGSSIGGDIGGGDGGSGGSGIFPITTSQSRSSGGGGAGGYSGNGGNGGHGEWTNSSSGTDGSGGGGGGGGAQHCAAGGSAGGGGGVGLFGEGTNGIGGQVSIHGSCSGGGGGGGSMGQNGEMGNPGLHYAPCYHSPTGQGRANGGQYGGGAGGRRNYDASAIPGNGAVRIIWAGDERYFPSTRTEDE